MRRVEIKKLNTQGTYSNLYGSSSYVCSAAFQKESPKVQKWPVQVNVEMSKRYPQYIQFNKKIWNCLSFRKGKFLEEINKTVFYKFLKDSTKNERRYTSLLFFSHRHLPNINECSRSQFFRAAIKIQWGSDIWINEVGYSLANCLASCGSIMQFGISSWKECS